MSGTVNAISSPVDFRIGQNPPSGIPAELQPVFDELYLGLNQIIRALTSNCGIGPQIPSQWPVIAGNSLTLLAGNLNRFYVVASETISYGAAINLWNNAGVINARNANATTYLKPCQGFCTLATGIIAGSIGEVQLNAGIARLSGLTIGANYYLSGTDGLLTSAPLVGAGNIEQFCGVAIDATHLSFNLGYWIKH